MPHDPNATPTPDFPRLTPTNHRVTSPPDENYNCIAWAVHDTARWWQPAPDRYWPIPATEESDTIDDLVRAHQSVGFIQCSVGDPEPGYEKLALYAESDGTYSHAARLLPNGKWSSKLGALEDIEHDTPDDVAGGVYGDIFGFMKRPVGP